jgi:putative hemolysin
MTGERLSLWLQAVCVLLALGGTAYFSAAEMALLRANRIRLRQRAQAGEPRARRALRLLEHRDQLLALFLMGQNGLSVIAAAVATGLIDRAFGEAWIAPVVATVGLTTLVVVGAEIVPKVIAHKHGTAFLLRDAKLLDFLHHLWLPVTGLVHLYMRGLLRLLGRDAAPPPITREELRLLVHEAEGGDEATRRERTMLASILDFRETVAREVMIPMSGVVALPKGASCDTWRAIVREHGFTRLPVYEEQRDRVVGLLNVFDLLYDPEPHARVDAYLRPIPIVPDSKRVDHLLLELQKTRSPMAIVVDEFGSCRGVVTVEDIAEEIVGEMADEHERPAWKIRRVAPAVFVVDALTDVDDIDQELGLRLPRGRYDTVGGLVLKRAGRVPRAGERFTIGGVIFEVLAASPYRIRTIKVTLPQAPPSPTA